MIHERPHKFSILYRSIAIKLVFLKNSTSGFRPHAMEGDIDIHSTVGSGHQRSWSRLGTLHDGNRSTKVHERRNEIQSSRGKLLFAIDDFLDVLILLLTVFKLQNGLWSSMPYLATWISSLVTSAIADWILTKEYMSCTAVRKTFATIGKVD